ncbi:phage integrase SAM-like domain-containing protein [Geobacillus stearothermophilus]|nr:phage integrase SAM-like domain-containing protein [Geobacillus stearothermophilus]
MNNRIIPVLGHVQLSQLTPMLLQNYVSDLKEEGLASSTIKKIYNIIKGSLDYAVNMELLPSNPAKKIQLPKCKLAHYFGTPFSNYFRRIPK